MPREHSGKGVAHLAEIAPEFLRLVETADYTDEKIVDGENGLRRFVAQMLNWQPRWVTFLYGIRAVLAHLLGIQKTGIPAPPHLTASDIAMKPGTRASFFTVERALDESDWVARVDDKHLTAWLAVSCEPLQSGRRRFHVLTIVRYHNWGGPIYFNIIRPFHHAVVGGMARAGAR